MPMHGIAGTGGVRRRGLDMGRDREGAHGWTGKIQDSKKINLTGTK